MTLSAARTLRPLAPMMLERHGCMRRLPLILLFGCRMSAGTGSNLGGPMTLSSIAPAVGAVSGGTRVTIDGGGFGSDVNVTIGGVPCSSVSVTDGQVQCTTGARGFQEGPADVVVTSDMDTVTLVGAFNYACTWTTSSGRQSCGAAPPGVAPQPQVTAWLTQMEPGSGVVANPGITNLDDTADFTLGTQSAMIETDGTGSPRTLSKMGMAQIDFTGKVARVWIKIEGIDRVRTLEVQLGDSNLASAFVFSLRGVQERQWLTDGDWVAIDVPWMPSKVVGTPDRTRITDVMVRVADDGAGSPVRLHVNGIALTDEASPRFPDGVVTFSFDDNFATMVDPAADILATHGFAATAYVITDMVDSDNRAKLADLQTLAQRGWDISVHAFTDVDHGRRYTNLTPAEVEDDMVNARAWLIDHGFTGYDHCAYPGGDFDPDVLALAGRYFTSCRTIYRAQREMFPPPDSRRLRVAYITVNVTLAQVEQYVDEAVATHEWLILVFHRFSDAPTLTTEWRTADFRALVDHVAASRLPVVPVTKLYATGGAP